LEFDEIVGFCDDDADEVGVNLDERIVAGETRLDLVVTDEAWVKELLLFPFKHNLQLKGFFFTNAINLLCLYALQAV